MATTDPLFLTVRQNALFEKRLQVLEGGLAQDYTNAALTFYIRANRSTADASASFSKGLANLAGGALARAIAQLRLDQDDSLPAAGLYWWDVRLVKAGASKSSGSDGDVNGATTFEAAGADWVTDGVVAGDVLVVATGANAGTYLIASVTDLNTLEVVSSDPFPSTGEAPGQTYTIYTAGNEFYFPSQPARLEIVGGDA